MKKLNKILAIGIGIEIAVLGSFFVFINATKKPDDYFNKMNFNDFMDMINWEEVENNADTLQFVYETYKNMR